MPHPVLAAAGSGKGGTGNTLVIVSNSAKNASETRTRRNNVSTGSLLVPKRSRFGETRINRCSVETVARTGTVARTRTSPFTHHD